MKIQIQEAMSTRGLQALWVNGPNVKGPDGPVWVYKTSELKEMLLALPAAEAKQFIADNINQILRYISCQTVYPKG